MTTKLTLSMDDQIIHSAKKYAESQGKSLSGLIENYLKSITAIQNKSKGISPQVLKLRGSLTLPKDFDYTDALGKAIGKKYAK